MSALDEAIQQAENSLAVNSSIEQFKPEVPLKGRWVWAVEYENGEIVEEYAGGDLTLDGLSFANDVTQSRVTTLIAIPSDPTKLQFIIKINREEDAMRPIFFRRNFVTVNPATNEQISHIMVECFGWQKTVNGKNVSWYVFILPNDNMVMTSNFQEI